METGPAGGDKAEPLTGLRNFSGGRASSSDTDTDVSATCYSCSLRLWVIHKGAEVHVGMWHAPSPGGRGKQIRVDCTV